MTQFFSVPSVSLWLKIIKRCNTLLQLTCDLIGIGSGIKPYRRPNSDRNFSGSGKLFAGALQLPQSVNPRSEEHTSELQSHLNLVCRLLLEKKKKQETYGGQTRGVHDIRMKGRHVLSTLWQGGVGRTYCAESLRLDGPAHVYYVCRSLDAQ